MVKAVPPRVPRRLTREELLQLQEKRPDKLKRWQAKADAAIAAERKRVAAKEARKAARPLGRLRAAVGGKIEELDDKKAGKHIGRGRKAAQTANKSRKPGRR